MMKNKYLLFFVCFFSAAMLRAQQNIIESLQTRRAGEGVVTVHQDAQITGMIGSRYVKNTADAPKVLKARGFRIQVYAGNNSRQARNEANSVAGRVKAKFPEIPVYTYFQPPRWLCRVGDYKSIEEAHVAMRRLKESGDFREVAIVREQINIPIE